MRHAQLAAVGLFLTLPAGLFITIDGAEVKKGQKQKPVWEKVWNKQVDARIQSLIRQVDSERMSKNLFSLSKDPLPYRKLNFTLPGHEKNTLYEADAYISGKLESGGYPVEREEARVQAFRRDVTNPIQTQFSPPMPEDPWFTAYNLYAVKKGSSHPDEIILLIAHKDSQSWIDSPGANDNGSGTITALEIATVLAKYPSRRTIRFLFTRALRKQRQTVPTPSNANNNRRNLCPKLSRKN